MLILNELFKFQRLQGETVIGLCANISYLLSTLIYPYMPNISLAIRTQLNLPKFNVVKEKDSYDSENILPDSYSHPVFFNKFYRFLNAGHKLGKIEPLFKRIMEADIKVWREKFAGKQETKPAEDAAAAKKANKKTPKTPKEPKDPNEVKEPKKPKEPKDKDSKAATSNVSQSTPSVSNANTDSSSAQ
jgi:methionyl-tRNA synthetase